MNISKIAELAGVSPATVSRYLNNGYVSEEKKERIREVIEKTGYIPSQSAQTLRTKKNNLIGVIVPRISSESISKMVQGITTELKNTKYNIILANTDNSLDKELEFLSIFRNNTVDGVIFIATIITKKHRQIMDTYQKPIIILSQSDNKFSCVYFDDFGASYGCTEKLIFEGCNKIAYIGVTPKDKSAGKARLEGYISALQKNNLSVNSKLMAECDFSSEAGYKSMERMLMNGQKFNGLFCATDTIALGAMRCLKEHDIKIPQDVKVIAIGDSKMSQLCTPTLSSAHLYYVTGGKETCRMMLDILDNGCHIMKHHKLGYELISRETTQSE